MAEPGNVFSSSFLLPGPKEGLISQASLQLDWDHVADDNYRNDGCIRFPGLPEQNTTE